MQAALDISFYVLGVVFTLGIVMVLLLIRDVLFHGRFNVLLPTVKPVPTTALDAAREVLQALKDAYPTASNERRDAIAYEVKHLENRIAALEDKAYTDQSDYYDAAKARERVWREWRTAHEQAQRAHFKERRQARNKADELRLRYRQLDREVEEEYQRAVARDAMALGELQGQGILTPEVLAPPRPAAPTAPAAPAGPAAQGPGEAAPQAGAKPAAPPRKWMSPLTPYPPAQGGLLGQADMARADVVKSERTYVDPTFSMAGLPGGVLSHADLTRSSFAEVEFTGVHRYAGCRFVATDLRRIELKRADGIHIFQDCDLHGASLAQAHLAGVVFRRCNLAGTHWRSARLDRVKFEQCNLDGVHWDGADLSRTVMSEDMLEQADFEFASKPPLNLRPGMESPPELASEPPRAAPAAPGPPPTQGGTPAGDTEAEPAPPAGAPEAEPGRPEPAQPAPQDAGPPEPGAPTPPRPAGEE